MVHIILLSGVSGAGKSTVCHGFEQKGFRIIENMPAEVLPAFLKTAKAKPSDYDMTVLVFDLASAKFAGEILDAEEGIEVRKILLGCAKDELNRRFRLTTHTHPLEAKGYSLAEAIDIDEIRANELRLSFDQFIDTTGLTPTSLKQIALSFVFGETGKKMLISFSSFGYKYGLPQDAELVFDCRVVPNPYWVEELQNLTGQDKEVKDFLGNKPETEEYYSLVKSLLDMFLKEAEKSGKARVFIYFGCTGGQHRSVYFAERFYEEYSRLYPCLLSHREMNRHYGDKKE